MSHDYGTGRQEAKEKPKVCRFPLTPVSQNQSNPSGSRPPQEYLGNTDLPVQSSSVQSVLDHVHQFKLALLFERHDVDEGLVEYSSFWQLVDEPGGHEAAWVRDIDLLGEPDVAVLHSEERLVVSHPHLRDRDGGQEEMHSENVYIFTSSGQHSLIQEV